MNGQYPMDFDALAKGDVLPESRLAEIVGLQPGSAAYVFAVLKLKERIEDETGIVCCSENGMIRLLTDREAAAYTWAQTHAGVRKLIRQASRRGRIDHAEMTMDERRACEAQDRIITMTALAARKALTEATKIAGDIPTLETPKS